MKLITYQSKEAVDILLSTGELKITDINQMKTYHLRQQIFSTFSFVPLGYFSNLCLVSSFLGPENIISGTARAPAQQNTLKQATEAHCLGCRSFFYSSICWSTWS